MQGSFRRAKVHGKAKCVKVRGRGSKHPKTGHLVDRPFETASHQAGWAA